MSLARRAAHAAGILASLFLCVLCVQSWLNEYLILHDRIANRTYFVFRGWIAVRPESLPSQMFPSPARFHFGRASNREWPPTLVRIPLWPFALVLAVWGSYPFLPWYKRWRRRSAGLCENCGYDLRGLTSSRCPECGSVFARPRSGNHPLA